jgi:hypothetical protein
MFFLGHGPCQAYVSTRPWTLQNLCFLSAMDLAKPMFLLGQSWTLPSLCFFSARHGPCQAYVSSRPGMDLDKPMYVSSRPWILPSLLFFSSMDHAKPMYVSSRPLDLAKPMFLLGHGPCQAYVSSRPGMDLAKHMFLLGQAWTLTSLCMFLLGHWTLPSLCFFSAMDLAKPMFLLGHGPCQAYVSSRPWTLPSLCFFPAMDIAKPACLSAGHTESLPSLCLCWTRRVLVKPMFHLLSHGFCQVYVEKFKTYHVKNRLVLRHCQAYVSAESWILLILCFYQLTDLAKFMLM